jgi:hypothetical protein
MVSRGTWAGHGETRQRTETTAATPRQAHAATMGPLGAPASQQLSDLAGFLATPSALFRRPQKSLATSRVEVVDEGGGPPFPPHTRAAMGIGTGATYTLFHPTGSRIVFARLSVVGFGMQADAPDALRPPDVTYRMPFVRSSALRKCGGVGGVSPFSPAQVRQSATSLPGFSSNCGSRILSMSAQSDVFSAVFDHGI